MNQEAKDTLCLFIVAGIAALALLVMPETYALLCRMIGG